LKIFVRTLCTIGYNDVFSERAFSMFTPLTDNFLKGSLTYMAVELADRRPPVKVDPDMCKNIIIEQETRHSLDLEPVKLNPLEPF
jgi:hypothetical protein